MKHHNEVIMLTTKQREPHQYNRKLTESSYSQSVVDTEVMGIVPNNRPVESLEKRIYIQLFYYLYDSAVNWHPKHQYTLLQGIKRADLDGFLQRELILGSTVHMKNKQKAHELLVQACERIIADIEKELGERPSCA